MKKILMTCSLMTVTAVIPACSAGGNGVNNDKNGATGGGAGTDGNPISTESSGGSSPSGGPGGGLLISTQDGGTSGTGAGLPCGTAASTTRACCSDQGTQTCTGGGEFKVWSPCMASTGVIQKCVGTERLPPPPPDASPPPPPPPPPPPSALCSNTAVNTEPEILAAYSPSAGQTVGANGQIKVWVSDENPPFIAPGEVVDPKTGVITTPGDRTAKAPDGYLWEPALYIAPQTAANGGTPHFPVMIKGSYNNSPPTRGTGTTGAPIDPMPTGTPAPATNPFGIPGPFGRATYTGEDIWDVKSLGLAPGTYSAEFLIFDGDKDRGIGCVTIVITP